MTVAMVAMRRLLPMRERYSLPPSEITAKVTEEAGLSDYIGEPEHRALTLVGHFAYGAVAGAVYAPVANKAPLPPILAGIAYGIIVWTVSYLGWLPALGLLPPATEHPTRRNVLMIVAHVVWGAVTGVLLDRLSPTPN
jgi:uncharacterized membrane protein YagU involved in acid resistance